MRVWKGPHTSRLKKRFIGVSMLPGSMELCQFKIYGMKAAPAGSLPFQNCFR